MELKHGVRIQAAKRADPISVEVPCSEHAPEAASALMCLPRAAAARAAAHGAPRTQTNGTTAGALAAAAQQTDGTVDR